MSHNLDYSKIHFKTDHLEQISWKEEILKKWTLEFTQRNFSMKRVWLFQNIYFKGENQWHRDVHGLLMSAVASIWPIKDLSWKFYSKVQWLNWMYSLVICHQLLVHQAEAVMLRLFPDPVAIHQPHCKECNYLEKQTRTAISWSQFTLQCYWQGLTHKRKN